MTRITLLLLSILSLCEAKRILFVAMPQGKSHRGSMYPLGMALVSKGHEVVFWSETILDKSNPPPGIKETLIHLTHPLPEHFESLVYMNSTFFVDMSWSPPLPSPFSMIAFPVMFSLCGSVCKQLLLHQEDEFRKIANQHWDLIVIDSLFTNCGHAVSLTNAQLHTPRMVIHTSAVEPGVLNSRAAGMNYVTITPGTPHISFDHRKFFHRVRSVIEISVWQIMDDFGINSVVEGNIKSVKDWGSYHSNLVNGAAVFFDYPSAIDSVRPNGLDNFETGTCAPGTPTPLPNDLETFVSDPTSKGTILIAFGTVVRLPTSPERVQKAFREGIKLLKEYRVIFQWTGPSLPDLGSHVKAMGWLPQFDILNHPKTRLFVSHGGLKSFKESICSETPILVFPVFGDQYRNAFQAVNKGFGGFLDKMNVTGESFAAQARHIASTESFSINVKRARVGIMDRVVPVLDEAAHRINTILKHKGPPKLWYRKGRDLHWFQYWCLDVIASVLIGLVVALHTLYHSAKSLIRYCCN